MATGALDANGIWQYGEDDSEATFSALLNKLASSTSTSMKTKGVVLTNNADQAIVTGTPTKLTFNTELLDTDGFHSTVSNTSRITIPTGLAGMYNVSAYIRWEGGSVTNPLILLTKNGVNQVRFTAPTGTFTPQFLSWNLFLAVGDYLELVVTHATGSNKSVSTVASNSFPNLDPQSPYFAAYRISKSN